MAWEPGIGMDRSLGQILERCEAGELAAGGMRGSKPATGGTVGSGGSSEPTCMCVSGCEETRGSRARY